MDRSLLRFLACLLTCALIGGSICGAAGPRSRLKQIKRQQRTERRQLKVEQKMWKRSFRGQHVPRAERLAEKHELQRNMRTLRLKQKDQIQQMKDEQRLAKYRNSHPLS